MTTAERARRISDEFAATELTAETRCSPDEMYRCPDSFIIVFRDGLSLDVVNAGRRDIAEGRRSELTMPDSAAVDVAALVPTSISDELRTEVPRPRSTQPAGGMRENTEYIPLARFLASTYNLTIEREVYCGHANWAVCLTPPGTDEAALALSIAGENDDMVRTITPRLAMFADSFYPRRLDERIDDIPSTGSGITPAQCNPDYWDFGEGYHYFQSKAHLAHTCWVFNNLNSITGPAYGAGLGAKACVLDSGVIPDHPDLPYGPGVEFPALEMPVDPSGQDPTYWDVNPPAFTTSEFTDTLGHGTAVAGVVAARGSNGGLAGMLPWGTVVPFRSSYGSTASGFVYPDGRSGENWYDRMAEGLLRAFRVRGDTGAYVVNLSWSHTIKERTVGGEPFVAEPWASMMDEITTDPRFAIVCSASNASIPVIDTYEHEGEEWFYGRFPAALANWDDIYNSQVFSVMSADIDDTRAPHSNYAGEEWPTSVSIAAPGGHDFVNDISTGILTLHKDGGYLERHGTSFAAPGVTGAIALLQSYVFPFMPDFSAEDVKLHLQQTGRTERWGGGAWDPTLKPIVDLGSAMTWVDIKYPDGMPDVPDQDLPRFANSVPVRIRAHFTGGVLQDDPLQAEVGVAIACLTGGISMEDPLPAGFSGPDPDFPEGDVYLYTTSIPLYDLPLLVGPCEMYATIDLPDRPTLVSHPVRFWAGTDEAAWEKTEIAPISMGMTVERSLVMDHADDRTLHVAWTEGNDITGEFHLRTAIENTPMLHEFTVTDLETATTEGLVGFTDLSIGHGIETGVLYQRRDDYDEDQELEHRSAFATVDNGMVTIEIDALSEPVLSGQSTSAHRRNVYVESFLTNGIDYLLGSRGGMGVWSIELIGSVPPNILHTNMWMLNYFGVHGPHPRMMCERWDTSAPPDDMWQVVYMATNPTTGQLEESVVPRVNGNYYYQSWIGTSYIWYPSDIDSLYTPAVFTRSQDVSTSPPSNARVEAALATFSSGWITRVIEDCSPSYADDSALHGLFGDAAYSDVTAVMAVVYYSGDQLIPLHNDDSGDLKIAYIPYIDGEWYPSNFIYTVDSNPAPVPIAVDVVNGRIQVVYHQFNQAGTQTQLVLASEPIYSWDYWF